MTDADMIEAMARAIGPSFIGNRMPDMSGDPLRKATPYERRRIDEAVTAALAVVQPELDRLRAENADLAHREKVRSEAINKCLTDANDRADYAHARADFCARLYDQREEYLAGLDATNAELRAENEALRRERVTVLEKALGEIESQALAAPLARDNFELIDMLQSVYGISSRARAALSAPALDGEGR